MNKRYIMDAVIVLLVVANVFVGVLNINARRPKCICDDCNRARVAGSYYCHNHEGILNERKLCLEVTSRNSK